LRQEWSTYTPDGRRLAVRREGDAWIAQCGSGREARSKLLDVAMIEAIRDDLDVIGHALGLDYAKWTREQADRIEHDLSDAA
jgi:hypothetical protein